MTPRHSDSSSEDYGIEADLRISYRRDFETEGEGRAVRPANRPVRSRTATKNAYNGIQRRRNKRWSW